MRGGSGTLYDFGLARDMTAFRTVQTHLVYLSATTCVLDGKAVNVKNEVIDTFSLDRCNK